jgi:hypothetical protein
MQMTYDFRHQIKQDTTQNQIQPINSLKSKKEPPINQNTPKKLAAASKTPHKMILIPIFNLAPSKNIPEN